MNSKLISLIQILDLTCSAEVLSEEPNQNDIGKNNKAYYISDDGAVHIPAFELPMSAALSPESKTAVVKGMVSLTEFWMIAANIYIPKKGVSKANQHRVLIHVHGGAFKYGARWVEKLTAMPIAVDGEIKVVSVDYRQYPEAKSPAALEDILVVYKELLKDYRPENIGTYGCSAGGYLAGQSVAWINDLGLPTPSAVGIFGQGIALGSDSSNFGIQPAINKAAWAKAGINRKEIFPPTSSGKSYFSDVDKIGADPLVFFAGNSIGLLREFPTSLSITSTRDGGLSATVATHTNHIKAGVEPDLHAWEGLEHCFITDHSILETADAQKEIIRFFERQLGKQGANWRVIDVGRTVLEKRK